MLFIFAMRIVDVSLYTLRIMMVVQGRRKLAWVFAFSQSLLFITVVRTVLADLSSPYKFIGYTAGYATGLVVGMLLENRIGLGYTKLRIISPSRGAEICEQLRAEGYGVTELAGRGKDGTVTILNLSVFRKDVEQVTERVMNLDENAFITAGNVRSYHRGFWHTPGRVGNAPRDR